MSRDPDVAPRVVVVGAGISGLTAAWRLARRPRPPEIVVLEQADRVGGKLMPGAVGGIDVDLGAEAVLARRPEATDLMAELGFGADLVHPRTSSASVLHAGRLHPLPPGTVMGVPTGPQQLRGLLSEPELARVAAEPDHPAPALTEDTDVASWVAARFGPAVLERLVEPLLGGVYAGHAGELSLQATVPQLWQLARRGGSVLQALAADGSPAPGSARAAARPAPVFAGLVGGVARLPLRLAERLAELGVQVSTGLTVRQLERTSDGWRLVAGAVGRERVYQADAVLLAVPPGAASRLLGPVCPGAAAALAQIPTASMAVIAATVPRELLAGMPGSGVLIPPVEAGTVKAVTFSSAKWAWVDRQQPDRVLVRMSIGRHHEEVVLQRDDDELVSLAAADLGGILGRPVRPLSSRVVRWGGALPQYLVGHVARVQSVRDAVAQLPGLAVCGAAFDGLGVPACIGAASDAAARIGAQLDRVPAPGPGPGAGRVG